MAKGSTFELNFCWPARLIQTFFKNLKYVERNGILIIDADIPRFVKTATLILHRILRCFGEASKLR